MGDSGLMYRIQVNDSMDPQSTVGKARRVGGGMSWWWWMRRRVEEESVSKGWEADGMIRKRKRPIDSSRVGVSD